MYLLNSVNELHDPRPSMGLDVACTGAGRQQTLLNVALLCLGGPGRIVQVQHFLDFIVVQ